MGKKSNYLRKSKEIGRLLRTQEIRKNNNLPT